MLPPASMVDESDEPDEPDEPDDPALGGGSAGTEHHVTVEPAHAGARLDALLAEATPLSRAAAQRLIEDGRVVVDGVAVTKPSARPRIGSAVSVRVPAPIAIELVAEDLPLSVLFED